MASMSSRASDRTARSSTNSQYAYSSSSSSDGDTGTYSVAVPVATTTPRTQKQKRKKKAKQKVLVSSLPLDGTTKRLFSATSKSHREMASRKKDLMEQFNAAESENRTMKKQMSLQNKVLHYHSSTVAGVEATLRRNIHEKDQEKRQQRQTRDKLMRRTAQLKDAEKQQLVSNSELKHLKLLTDKDSSLPPLEKLQDDLSVVQNSLERERDKVRRLEEELKKLQTEQQKTCGQERRKFNCADREIIDLQKENRELKKSVVETEKKIAAQNMYRRGQSSTAPSSMMSTPMP